MRESWQAQALLLEANGRWHLLDEPSRDSSFCWDTNLLLGWPGTEQGRLDIEIFFQYA